MRCAPIGIWARDAAEAAAAAREDAALTHPLVWFAFPELFPDDRYWMMVIAA